MNIFEKLTNQFRETLDSSVALALNFKNQEVQIAHLAFALLSNSNSVLNTALNKMNVDIRAKFRAKKRNRFATKKFKRQQGQFKHF